MSLARFIPQIAYSPDEASGATPVATEVSSAAPAAALPVEAAPVVAAPAAPVEAPKVEAVVAAPESPASLLSDAEGKPAPAEPAKVEAPNPVAEAKTDDAAPAKVDAPPETATAPAFESFKLPDQMNVEQERMGEFTNLLGEFETGTKAEHAKVQELGQKLVDFYASEVKTLQDRMISIQQESFAKAQQDWVTEVKTDPEVGGNRFDTSLRLAASVIEEFGGNTEQQKALRQRLKLTGATNDVNLIRLLANVGQVLSEGKPVVANKPPPAPRSSADKRYGSRGNGAAAS